MTATFVYIYSWIAVNSALYIDSCIKGNMSNNVIIVFAKYQRRYSYCKLSTHFLLNYYSEEIWYPKLEKYYIQR